MNIKYSETNNLKKYDNIYYNERYVFRFIYCTVKFICITKIF